VSRDFPHGGFEENACLKPMALIRIIHPCCQAFPSAIHKVPFVKFVAKQYLSKQRRLRRHKISLIFYNQDNKRDRSYKGLTGDFAAGSNKEIRG
jgi:hypothetical protein